MLIDRSYRQFHVFLMENLGCIYTLRMLFCFRNVRGQLSKLHLWIFKVKKHQIAEYIWPIGAEKAHFRLKKGIITPLLFIVSSIVVTRTL